MFLANNYTSASSLPLADEHLGRSLDLLWSDTSLVAQLLAAVQPGFAIHSGRLCGIGFGDRDLSVLVIADVDTRSVWTRQVRVSH